MTRFDVARSVLDATEKVEQAVAARNETIRAARSDGWSLRELAALTGISHQTISNICKESGEAK